jgi:hypothetical protein
MTDDVSVFALLLRQRGRLLWNRLTRGPRRGRRLVGTLLAITVTSGFLILAGLNVGLVIDRLALTDRTAAVRLLPLLLTAAAALTFVTSLSSAFHHLFAAGDLELLMAAPVPRHSLFALKVLEIWRDSLHVILFEGAALYAFGHSLDLAPQYYVAAAAIGFVFTVCAGAAGAVSSLALARIRFGESILGVSRLLAILLFLPIGVLGVPALGLGRNRISVLLSQPTLGALTAELRNTPEPPTWAPTAWAAHVLMGDEFAALSLLLLAAMAAVIFTGSQLAFDALFQAGWERARFSSNPRTRWLPRLRVPTPTLSGGPTLVVLLKDWRTILRDPRWRTATVISLVALGLPAVALFTADPFARSGHSIRFWFGMLPVPYLAFLVGTQQGASTLAYEGRNLALLRAAPIRTASIVTAKVLGGLGLVLLVTWTTTLVLGLSRSGQPLELATALLVASWLALGATLAAVAGAALTADFEGDNPQRRVGCLGMLLTAGLSLFFCIANTGTIVWWVVRGMLRLPRPVVAVVPLLDLALPMLALTSIVAILVACRIGMQRIASWETS